MTFAESLGQIMDSKKITNRALAKAAYITASTVYDYRHGKSYPLEDVGIRMAEYLGCSLEDLKLDYSHGAGPVGMRRCQKYCGPDIAELMEEQGLSRKKLASMAGLSPTSINKAVKSTARLEVKTLKLILKALGEENIDGYFN